jgi:hypothetical protein
MASTTKEAAVPTARGGGSPVAALEGGSPFYFFFLGSYWYCRGALHLRNGSQGRGKFAAMGGASKK